MPSRSRCRSSCSSSNTRAKSDKTYHLIVSFRAGEQIEARRKEGLDDDLRDAFGEVMNMAAAILSRIGEAMELPALARDETREGLDAEGLGGGRLRRARWRLVLPDQPEGRIELWVPEETLSEWFGEALGEGGSDPEPPEAAGGGTLVIVDPGEADREAVEAMEPELGCAIWALEPDQLGAESFEELADASAVILEWDLGPCTGLDVLHALQAEERTAHLPVALASARPTRRMVMSALHAGATTFIMKPYETWEIRTRLGFATPEAVVDDAPRSGPESEAAAKSPDEGGSRAGDA